MLASLTVHLFPVENAVLPPTMGHYVHAAFLDILRQADTGIAERLHQNHPCKPFTVSPLQGRFDKQEKGKIFIRAGTECWMRFTILDDSLLSAVNRAFLEGNSSTLRLGSNTFQVTKVTANRGDGNWSAYTTFEEIMDSASAFDRLNIRFYSPTAFKESNGTSNGSQNYVLPEPSHCFKSWARKWNTLSSIQIDEEAILNFARKHIRFSRYSIKTRIMNFGGYTQLGFMGDCEYQFVNGAPMNGSNGKNNGDLREVIRQADALAKFAFYSGTGYKTTMGMGQTKKQNA